MSNDDLNQTGAHECADCRRAAAAAAQPISVSRRGVLAGGAGLALAALGMPGLSLAALPTDHRLIFVLLRGGMDGLAAVPAYADPAYKAARGQLAIDDPNGEQGALDLNGFFGLHPSLKNLHGMYRDGDLAVFHAVATPYRERSHFDAQKLLEVGGNQLGQVRDGWMNRMLGLYGAAGGNLGIAFNQTIPLILSGEVPVASWAPGGGEAPPEFLERLSHVYASDPLFSRLLNQAVAADALADQAGAEMAGRGMTGRGPRQVLQRTLATAVEMLKAENGHRMAVVEVGGWDTHANQGAAAGGLANQLGQLDEGLGTLNRELQPIWNKTAIVVMTEFGRTVAINGTRGTDHGTGGVAFLAGGAVNGGHVLTNWPGLDQSQLYEGRDLMPTLDSRSILKSVMTQHLGLPAGDIDRFVLPNSGAATQIRQLFATA
ncbi:MAG: DUF1501 domain-containing protein [Alphaproteobacteria bacterium]|nr:DUF1501 domain-containing protein [Alphaproteobacteria bacterium SS10]